MSGRTLRNIALAALFIGGVLLAARDDARQEPPAPEGRRDVVFWHFWGGKYRGVVEEIVRRFNESQDVHFVRAVAMPGQNLDLKFFLTMAGGTPPDLLNQDDPVVADWAHRGALLSVNELAGEEEAARLGEWLFPTARRIGTYDGRLYAVCNGLDIRALYLDRRVLDAHGLSAPTTLEELDWLALEITPPVSDGRYRRFGYLPDPRRLWAWGIVFGGSFYDHTTGEVTADSEPIVAALEWMSGYSRRYGADNVEAFRTGDQALTGASFPLLQGRYAILMDGQWRVAEMAAAGRAARAEGKPVPQYSVIPLPAPAGGRRRAGWVNGNFFVVPKGAKNSEGAWEFIKFWSGFDGHEAEAARACAAGGWIPASQAVVDQKMFQDFLEENPAFRTFVDLAGSENQVPTPVVPNAGYFHAQINRAAQDAMYLGVEPREALESAARRIRARLEEVRH